MFTLAHELAHVAFGVSAAFDLREMQPASAAVEQACNRVAAEFLVPAAELRRVWDRQPSDPFEAVARYFKVSQIVAARRLLDLGLISRDEFFDFYRRYTSEERREKEQTKNGPDFHTVSPQRVGARFAVELARALKQGKILHLEAYRLTGLQGNAFSELSRRAMEGALL
jgi:Zn-dependent peptidase ImmA (M78 family)